MAKRRRNRLREFHETLKALGALAPLVTALTAAMLAGRTMGFW
jgi:hypothetical protein